MRDIQVGLFQYVKFLRMAARLENQFGELDLEKELGLNITIDVHGSDFPDELEELFKLLDGPYKAIFWEMYKRKRRNNGKENNSQNETGQGQQTSSEILKTQLKGGNG